MSEHKHCASGVTGDLRRKKYSNKTRNDSGLLAPANENKGEYVLLSENDQCFIPSTRRTLFFRRICLHRMLRIVVAQQTSASHRVVARVVISVPSTSTDPFQIDQVW